VVADAGVGEIALKAPRHQDCGRLRGEREVQRTT
jgi:hypothetical protein